MGSTPEGLRLCLGLHGLLVHVNEQGHRVQGGACTAEQTSCVSSACFLHGRDGSTHAYHWAAYRSRAFYGNMQSVYSNMHGPSQELGM